MTIGPAVDGLAPRLTAPHGPWPHARALSAHCPNSSNHAAVCMIVLILYQRLRSAGRDQTAPVAAGSPRKCRQCQQCHASAYTRSPSHLSRPAAAIRRGGSLSLRPRDATGRSSRSKEGVLIPVPRQSHITSPLIAAAPVRPPITFRSRPKSWSRSLVLALTHQGALAEAVAPLSLPASGAQSEPPSPLHRAAAPAGKTDRDKRIAYARHHHPRTPRALPALASPPRPASHAPRRPCVDSSHPSADQHPLWVHLACHRL